MEVFGTEAQRRMAVAGENLINLIGDDPRFCSHGRGIQVSNEYDGALKDAVAMALIHSNEVLGATGFKTGIAPSNIPSARLCEGLGPSDSGRDIIALIDPENYGEDRLTK